MCKISATKLIFAALVVGILLTMPFTVNAADTTPPEIGTIYTGNCGIEIQITDNEAVNLVNSQIKIFDGSTGQEITDEFYRGNEGDGTKEGKIIFYVRGEFHTNYDMRIVYLDIIARDRANNETFGQRATKIFCYPCSPGCYISIAPDHAPIGETLDVTITSNDKLSASFNQYSTVSFYCSGVTVNKVTVKSPTELVANISIAEDAPPGICDVSIITGTEVVTLAQVFKVLTPVCDSLSPNSVTAGNMTDVNIRLLNTTDLTNIDNLNVSFSCTGITVNSVTATSENEVKANISVACDAPQCIGDITVTGTGLGTLGVTCSSAFTVNESPPCTLSLEPTSVRSYIFFPHIAKITIKGGAVCHTFTEQSTVEIEGFRYINVTSVTDNEIKANVLIPPRFLIKNESKTVTIKTGDDICTGELVIN